MLRSTTMKFLTPNLLYLGLHKKRQMGGGIYSYEILNFFICLFGTTQNIMLSYLNVCTLVDVDNIYIHDFFCGFENSKCWFFEFLGKRATYNPVPKIHSHARYGIFTSKVSFAPVLVPLQKIKNGISEFYF